MQTHADPSRRTLTTAALAQHEQDGCPPKCCKCGQPLKVGDYVDSLHPFDHTGNLCGRHDNAKVPVEDE